MGRLTQRLLGAASLGRAASALERCCAHEAGFWSSVLMESATSLDLSMEAGAHARPHMLVLCNVADALAQTTSCPAGPLWDPFAQGKNVRRTRKCLRKPQLQACLTALCVLCPVQGQRLREGQVVVVADPFIDTLRWCSHNPPAPTSMRVSVGFAL